MTIGIDARFYGPLGKGLGRYTQEVVDNLIKIASAESPSGEGVAFNYVVFLSPENFNEFNEDWPGVRKVLLPVPWYSWREQIMMPFYIWREKIDLMHFPHFNVPILTPVPFVVTIHDLILTHFPTTRATTLRPWLYSLKNLAYRLVISVAVHRAKKIITVSEFTKKDLVEQFKIAATKIAVTYEGVANLAKGRDSLFVAKLDRQETLEEYHIAKDFLLYVGNAYPHKNLERLLKVFSDLHGTRPDLRLVLVGKDDYFYTRVKNIARSLNLWQAENKNSPVIFAGYVPDAQLEILYQAARAYVFPSLMEGFGLPGLEAMGYGAPVVSSNATCLPEVYDDAAHYFDPLNTDDMARAIDEVLSDEGLRNSLIAEGYKQIAKYSWERMAKQTYSIYIDAVRNYVRP